MKRQCLGARGQYREPSPSSPPPPPLSFFCPGHRATKALKFQPKLGMIRWNQEVFTNVRQSQMSSCNLLTFDLSILSLQPGLSSHEATQLF